MKRFSFGILLNPVVLAVFYMALIALTLTLLTSCQAHMSIVMTDQWGTSREITIDSVRRTAIGMSNDEVTIITGQVAINDETVQALGKGAITVLSPQ